MDICTKGSKNKVCIIIFIAQYHIQLHTEKPGATLMTIGESMDSQKTL